jgi:hypothetical protein
MSPVPAKSPVERNRLRRLIDRYDALFAEMQRLDGEHAAMFRAIPGDATDRQVEIVARRMDRLDERIQKLRKQWRTIADIPEVNAFVLKREARESRS